MNFDDCDLTRRTNAYGNTILHIAVELGRYDDIRRILSQNTVINIKNRHGDTPFDIAVKSGNLDIVKLFPTLDVTDLHIEYAFEHRDVLTFLIENLVKGELLKKECYTPRSYLSRKEQFRDLCDMRCVLCSSIDLAIVHTDAYALDLLLRAHRNNDEEHLGIFDINNLLLSCLIPDYTKLIPRYSNDHPTSEQNLRERRRACVKVLLNHGASPFREAIADPSNNNRSIYETPTTVAMKGITFDDHKTIFTLLEGISYQDTEIMMKTHSHEIIKHAIHNRRSDVVYYLVSKGCKMQRDNERAYQELSTDVFTVGRLEYILVDSNALAERDYRRYETFIYIIGQYQGFYSGSIHPEHLEMLDIMMTAGVNLYGCIVGDRRDTMKTYVSDIDDDLSLHVSTFHQRLTLRKLTRLFI